MSNSRSRSCGHQHTTIFVFILMTTVCCTSGFHCPQMVEIGWSVNLTCNVDPTSGAHSYTTPGWRTAATCHLLDGDCITTGNFIASVINTTSSVLTIPKTLKTHEGVWKCVDDANNPDTETCRMSVFKLPTCEITSDQNTSSLSEGDRLTLSVHLTGSVCSEPILNKLMTGSVNTTLINGTGTDTTPEVFTIDFNVTSSHFGDVQVMYTCRSDSWNVSCQGVKQLVEAGSMSGVTTSSKASDSSTAPPSSDGPGTETSVSSLKIIVGITVAIAFIIIIIIIVVLYKKRKRSTPNNNEARAPEVMQML